MLTYYLTFKSQFITVNQWVHSGYASQVNTIPWNAPLHWRCVNAPEVTLLAAALSIVSHLSVAELPKITAADWDIHPT